MGDSYSLFEVDDQVFSYYAPLKKVKRFVESHYQEPLPLATVAGIACLERTYFSRYFHEKTGICFKDWLIGLRVKHALVLMRSQNQTITQIGLAAGFQDLRTFERAFERCTGMSPQKMRNEIRNQRSPTS
jgi:transcriptional regulator GlxA family with amidase domain